MVVAETRATAVEIGEKHRDISGAKLSELDSLDVRNVGAGGLKDTLDF